ncbi:MAG: hypothetical protein WB646_11050 [Steroidobacteraceae bacterium]
MSHKTLKSLLLAACTLPALSLAAPSHAAAQSAYLSQAPVVMRLSKDEFRIAFGINAARCATNEHGCNGVIRYRVDWKADDGTARSEIKHVNYVVVPRSSRALTVDRQYFDTAEGAHTTEVVKVSVDMITCVDGGASSAPQTAALVSPR